VKRGEKIPTRRNCEAKGRNTRLGKESPPDKEERRKKRRFGSRYSRDAEGKVGITILGCLGWKRKSNWEGKGALKRA